MNVNKKQAAGEAVTQFIQDGMILGLGTGSTAYYAINAVGELIKKGMNLKAVATSNATWRQAQALEIPLLTIDEVSYIDLAIDGVDEIDPSFNAVKGGGGALFREKVVATLAKEVVWIMDDSKLVKEIGTFPLPVEVVPYGSQQVFQNMKELGFQPILRRKENELFVTDNGNYIIDLHLGAGFDIQNIEQSLNHMVGVVEHGLFLNMCKAIVVGVDEGVRVIYNQ